MSSVGISDVTFTSGKQSTAARAIRGALIEVPEDENRRLKKLLAEAMLDNAALKDHSKPS